MNERKVNKIGIEIIDKGRDTKKDINAENCCSVMVFPYRG